MDENFNQQNGEQPNASQGNTQQGNYQQGNYQQGNYQQGNYQQGNYQQGNYQQPSYQPNYQMNEEQPLTVGEWFITMLIMAIPCAGIIMTFVWAFGEGNKSRKNFCRAALIWALVGIVIYVVLLAAFGATLARLATMQY